MSKCNQKILLKSTQMPICYGFDLFFVVLEQFVFSISIKKKPRNTSQKRLFNESCAVGKIFKILICILFLKRFLGKFG